MTVPWPRRFKRVPATTNTAADATLDFCAIDGNLSFNTIKLRGCSFSGAFSLTTVGALTCDFESFKNLIAAATNITAVASFVPNFPRFTLHFGASTLTSGQLLVPGGPNVVSVATGSEGTVQLGMADSYVLLGITGRAVTQPCTLTVRKGGVSQSMTCSPAASGNDKDFAIAHWVSGNQYDLISMIGGGTAGGLARGTIEGVYL